MKHWPWGKILSGAVIILSLVMVLFIVFGNPELENAWEVLTTLETRWFVACLLCFAGYVWAEGAGLCAFLRMEGFSVTLPTATHFSFAGLYYANITPGASGGQPMQVYLMRKRGIPGGVATSALTARYFFNQMTVVLIAVALWMLNSGFVASQVGQAKLFIVLGCLVNFATVPIVVLVMLNRPLVERLGRWGIGFLARRRLCKQPDAWEARMMDTLDHFHGSLFDLLRHPAHLLLQLVISIVEMLCLMLVPLMVYKALGLSGTPWYHLVTVAYLLFVSASYTPLPGASGAQEGGFLVYFAGLFPSGTLSVALLVWRFTTYYLCLLLGAADQVYSSLRAKRSPIARQNRPGS
ncbi:MAG: flippase-like domain-containing protein [Christensenellaceae bacterium]|nr:flippase-like domain-containing protein [Christensenellaceae bacterium]